MVNTWKIVAAALVIFASGVMTGALSVGIAGNVQRRKTPEKRTKVEVVQAVPSNFTTELPRREASTLATQPPGAARMEMFRRLDREMNLAPGQREKLGVLIDGTEKRLREIWDPVAPEARKALHELRKRIQEDVLTPDQRPAFDRFLKGRASGDRPTPARRTAGENPLEKPQAP